VPAPTPVITPPAVAVARAELFVDQLPPDVPSVNEIVRLPQTVLGPLIAPGCVFTVTTAVAGAQPVFSVKLMVVVPEVTPVTMPDDEPTVATSVLELDHVPAPGPDDNATADPIQVFSVPVIAVGTGLTVIVDVADAPQGLDTL